MTAQTSFILRETGVLIFDIFKTLPSIVSIPPLINVSPISMPTNISVPFIFVFAMAIK